MCRILVEYRCYEVVGEGGRVWLIALLDGNFWDHHAKFCSYCRYITVMVKSVSYGRQGRMVMPLRAAGTMLNEATAAARLGCLIVVAA
jgi:hypothetical protein